MQGVSAPGAAGSLSILTHHEDEPAGQLGDAHSRQIDEPVAFEAYGADATAGAGTAYALHADRLGSVIAVTEQATGTVAARYEYDAFGQRTVLSAAVDQDYGFTCREVDAETGLYHYRVGAMCVAGRVATFLTSLQDLMENGVSAHNFTGIANSMVSCRASVKATCGCGGGGSLLGRIAAGATIGYAIGSAFSFPDGTEVLTPAGPEQATGSTRIRAL